MKSSYMRCISYQLLLLTILSPLYATSPEPKTTVLQASKVVIHLDTKITDKSPATTLPPKPVQPAPQKANIEVCFVLDTTGSMSGLIQGAKDKIIAITNKILQSQSNPKVKIALVAYRDKGDKYVTKSSDFTDNIDKIFASLATFQARGGGDTPENVNQGLHDALQKMTWSTDDKTLRLIYLVGDCPPHNEYQDVPQYQHISKTANQKGIYINTILCGNNSAAKKAWNEIANATQGKFIQIAQEGNVVIIQTPYDKKLSELNSKITRTVILSGTANEQRTASHFNRQAEAMDSDALMVQGADRAENCLILGRAGSGDLLQAIEEGKVKIDNLPTERLSAKMKKMSSKEQTAYIQTKQAERKKILGEIRGLAKKRSAYIQQAKDKLSKSGKKSGFDDEVFKTLKEQAKRKGIKY